MSTLAFVVALAAVSSAQQLPVQITPTAHQRFVDFHDDLSRPGVSVVLAEIDRIDEGRKKRLRDGGRLGTGTTTMSISGTAFWEVPTRARLDVERTLAGPTVEDGLVLGFDMQLARLPDGTEQRQLRTAGAPRVEAERLALWVIEKVPKKNESAVLCMIPLDPRFDTGDSPAAAFTEAMEDFVAINVAMHELESALEAAESDGETAPAAEAVEALRAAVAREPEMNVPEHDALRQTKVGPLLRRARDRLAELEPEPEEAEKDEARDG